MSAVYLPTRVNLHRNSIISIDSVPAGWLCTSGGRVSPALARGVGQDCFGCCRADPTGMDGGGTPADRVSGADSDLVCHFGLARDRTFLHKTPHRLKLRA